VPHIADVYGISRNHLLKVAAGLSEQHLIRTFRGKYGGMQLALAPEEINIGQVVDHMEGAVPLVDCAVPPCPILPTCELNHVLQEARQAFLSSLHRHTLADLLAGQRPALLRLLNTAEGSALP
jgi:Rrf2 family nitric oxide-sensitive transcriptional repressor